MKTDISTLCIVADSSIRQAIDCIERSVAKIALVVDDEKHLLDTITDGDIRRAILSGIFASCPRPTAASKFDSR